MKKILLIGLMVLALVSYAAAQSQLDAIKKTVPLPDDINVVALNDANLRKAFSAHMPAQKWVNGIFRVKISGCQTESL